MIPHGNDKGPRFAAASFVDTAVGGAATSVECPPIKSG